MKKFLVTLLCTGSLAIGLSLSVAKATTHDGALSEGEIRKIDQESGRVTLSHGPIENLQMPGMTMMFQVMPVEQLEELEAGDKVRFRAVQDNGKLLVTEIEKAE
ncbi:copper-binding protein [Halopseudomonas salina]|uniref:Cu and Ag efflux protein CusF n=1 Tax=Halopseudomonas salina TaxID=1323744 RepID=A0ABQ1Q4V2_9GAMM|nr:copper-binding protein [Halopseudomonas salina]GGD12358.1 hypothetical protein GCM10007418_34140 [Halopseudomonas salina]